MATCTGHMTVMLWVLYWREIRTVIVQDVIRVEYAPNSPFLLPSHKNYFLSVFNKSRPTYQVEKINKVGVCQKREFAVRSSSCEV